jgi:hypothetical protein
MVSATGGAALLNLALGVPFGGGQQQERQVCCQRQSARPGFRLMKFPLPWLQSQARQRRPGAAEYTR